MDNRKSLATDGVRTPERPSCSESEYPGPPEKETTDEYDLHFIHFNSNKITLTSIHSASLILPFLFIPRPLQYDVQILRMRDSNKAPSLIPFSFKATELP
jgi:hypothetical protein